MSKYNIPFYIQSATYRVDGKEGVYESLKKLFTECIEKEYKNILVFEDDILFLEKPGNFMPLCLWQLPKDYDCFFLGLNHLCPFEKFYSNNLLPVRMAYGLHAVGYSRTFMEKFLNTPKELPVDRMIAKTIMQEGKMYAAYPMIATQRLSRSSIDNYSPITPGIEKYWDAELQTANLGQMMVDNYEKAVAHLL